MRSSRGAAAAAAAASGGSTTAPGFSSSRRAGGRGLADEEESSSSVWTHGTGAGGGGGGTSSSSSRGGGGGGAGGDVVAAAADDEQSYYTHYSAGSMGLAKRSNKQLSLVTYLPLGGENDHDTDTDPTTSDGEATTTTTAGGSSRRTSGSAGGAGGAGAGAGGANTSTAPSANTTITTADSGGASGGGSSGGDAGIGRNIIAEYYQHHHPHHQHQHHPHHHHDHHAAEQRSPELDDDDEWKHAEEEYYHRRRRDGGGAGGDHHSGTGGATTTNTAVAFNAAARDDAPPPAASYSEYNNHSRGRQSSNRTTATTTTASKKKQPQQPEPQQQQVQSQKQKPQQPTSILRRKHNYPIVRAPAAGTDSYGNNVSGGAGAGAGVVLSTPMAANLRRGESTGDALFDHSSSTHKARGAHPPPLGSVAASPPTPAAAGPTAAATSPSVSSSMSSSSRHWRTTRTKPDLSVITDVMQEEEEEEESSSQELLQQPQQQRSSSPLKKTTRRVVAEDLTHDDIHPVLSPVVSPSAAAAAAAADNTAAAAAGVAVMDGADTRNRRRERLTRLARIRSPTSSSTTTTTTAVGGGGGAKPAAAAVASLSPSSSRNTLSPNRRRSALLEQKRYASGPTASVSAAAAAQRVTSPARSRSSPRNRYAVNKEEEEGALSPTSRKEVADNRTPLSPRNHQLQYQQQQLRHQQQQQAAAEQQMAAEQYYYTSSKNLRHPSPASPNNNPTNNGIARTSDRYYGSAPLSPQKAPRGHASSSKTFFPDEREDEQEAENAQEDEYYDNTSPHGIGHQPFMDKFLQKYNHKKQAMRGQEHQPQPPPSQVPQPSQHVQWSPPSMMDPTDHHYVANDHYRSLSTVREVDGSTVVDTISDNSSVLTHNLEEGPPCIRHFVRGARNLGKDAEICDNVSVMTHKLQEGPQCIQQFFQSAQRSYHVGTDADGNPCVGYTQKCTSFVTGVWKSCGISGYQTESKKSLLQLEMIAEQSVSSIYQMPHQNQYHQERQSPDAFQQYSRNLLAQSDNKNEFQEDEDDYDVEDVYDATATMTTRASDSDKNGGRSGGGGGGGNYTHHTYPDITEIGSDEATATALGEEEEDNGPMLLPFGSWNVENALTTIGAKVQEVVGMKEDRHNDSMMDDMRHMFDSLSTYYTPHHQPYYGDDPSTVPPNEDKNVFQYRHGVTNSNSRTHPGVTNSNDQTHLMGRGGGGGQSDSSRTMTMFRHDTSSHDEEDDEDRASLTQSPKRTTTATLPKMANMYSPRELIQQQQQQQQQFGKNNSDEAPCPNEQQDPEPKQEQERVGAIASIYSSVARNTKDRRSMFLELQRRRMRQTHQRKDELTEGDERTNTANDEPTHGETEETAILRQLYVGLYDKIHDESSPQAGQQQEAQIEELQQDDHADIHEDGNDDHDGASEDEEDDYAVVWAASEASALSPRHSAWAASAPSDNSMASPRQTVWAASEASMTSPPRRSEGKGGSLVDNDTNDDEDDDEDEEEYLDFETKASSIKDQTHLEVPTLNEPASDAPSVDLQRSSCDSPYDDCKSTHTRYLDAQEFCTDHSREEKPASPPSLPLDDPTLSGDDSSIRAANAGNHESEDYREGHNNADDKDNHYEGSEDDDDDDDTAHLIPAITTGTSTTGTNEMDELVHTFLESKSGMMSDNLRDNSESSRSMVLLAEDSFHRTDSRQEQQQQQQQRDCSKSLENSPEEEEKQQADVCAGNLEEPQTHYDVTSVQSEDHTLADSTMVSGYSSSTNTQELSMAESIVSDGLNSRNSSSRSRSDATPDLSEVPPEIAQPLGPISEYQVLYQISEEEDSEESSSDQASESFEHQNDVPFDEDVSLEDYRKKTTTARKVVASLCQWMVLGALVYYYLSFGGGWSTTLPTTEKTMDRSEVIPAAANIDSIDYIRDDMRVVQATTTRTNKRQKQEKKKPPAASTEPAEEIAFFDGITVVEGDVSCHSVPFTVGESVSLSESEAYRHTWAMELEAALKEH